MNDRPQLELSEVGRSTAPLAVQAADSIERQLGQLIHPLGNLPLDLKLRLGRHIIRRIPVAFTLDFLHQDPLEPDRVVYGGVEGINSGNRDSSVDANILYSSNLTLHLVLRHNR